LQDIDESDALDQLASSVNSRRLAILCGAGLSMSAPSSLPSAWTLANRAKQKYDAQYGHSRAPLSEDIENQAEFFFGREELQTVYLRSLVDPNAFAGKPNHGHEAIADLTLASCLAALTSTNVDTLIEAAGLNLYGNVWPSIKLDQAATAPAEIAPLVKIHGCWNTDKPNTIWAPSQLASSPTKERVEELSDWLSQRMLNCDLLIVGFFTDWDYLNCLIEHCLTRVSPSKIFVVDPASSADLLEKAPALAEAGARATTVFAHVRETGDSFLTKLRLQFSKSYVRQVLSPGLKAYREQFDADADPSLMNLDEIDNPSLWQLRRNIEGALPNQPAQRHEPIEAPVLGFIIIRLLAAGATWDGPLLKLEDRFIRVIGASGKFVHDLEKSYSGSVPPGASPDVTIAVGAAQNFLPPDIARSSETENIVRPASGQFCTDRDFEEVLEIA
jgi:hypothetical protein|tara:strand:+ start:1511 stop:2842 length:1332 start_codon:yes stop_codon:yes gene_type:complete